MIFFQSQRATPKIFIAQHCLGPWSLDEHTQEASCVIQVSFCHTSHSIVYCLFLNIVNIFRVTVCSMNSQKQPIYRECSGIKWAPYSLCECVTSHCVIKQSFPLNRQASLGKNEMVTMLDLNPLLTVFPLLLSFNFCVSTPLITPQVLTPIRSKFERPHSCRSVARW